MNNNTETIAILDHDNHILYLEEIDMDVIDEKYNGEEEEYIKANYDLGSVGLGITSFPRSPIILN